MEINKPEPGTINWRDLTVENAEELKEFYKAVAGWEVQEIPMKNGDKQYSDFLMKDSNGKGAAGICHLKGVNTGVPPQWIMYISIENIHESVEQAKNLGGKVLKEYTSKDGSLLYAMIEDPAGAVFALAKI